MDGQMIFCAVNGLIVYSSGDRPERLWIWKAYSTHPWRSRIAWIIDLVTSHGVFCTPPWRWGFWTIFTSLGWPLWWNREINWRGNATRRLCQGVHGCTFSNIQTHNHPGVSPSSTSAHHVPSGCPAAETAQDDSIYATDWRRRGGARSWEQCNSHSEDESQPDDNDDREPGSSMPPPLPIHDPFGLLSTSRQSVTSTYPTWVLLWPPSFATSQARITTQSTIRGKTINYLTLPRAPLHQSRPKHRKMPSRLETYPQSEPCVFWSTGLEIQAGPCWHRTCIRK